MANEVKKDTLRYSPKLTWMEQFSRFVYCLKMAGNMILMR